MTGSGHGAPTADDQFQFREVGLLPIGDVVLEHLEHGRHGDVVGNAPAFRRGRRSHPGRNRNTGWCPAGVNQRNHEDVRPADMEERELKCGFMLAP